MTRADGHSRAAVTDPVGAVLRRGLGILVRRGLRGVWVSGAIPRGAFVWAANHHSWWDPFVASAVLERHGGVPCLIMLQQNLGRYSFVRRLGVFGTAEHRRGLSYLADGRVLIIYPEGELRPAGPPGELADGAAWYARRAGVPLSAVAMRVVMRGHEAPEAYTSFVPVAADGTVREVTARLATALAAQLSHMDALTRAADPRRPLPGYRPVVRGRRSVEERIDAVRWGRVWPA